MRDAWKWVVGAVVAVAVLVPAGTWIYINVIEGDPPAKLTLDSAGSGQPVGTTTTVAAATSNSTAATTATTPTTAAATPAGALTYKPGASSIVGYRVNEVLFGQKNEAVGRTNKITGSMTLDGVQVSAVDLIVDMKSVSSDNSQRDGQFQGRIMATSIYPTATFKLTQPLVLSNVPADSTVVNAKATGDLTLHGVTKSVTFDLAAQRDGANIKVNGTIPVVFADYKIANPSAGPATTEDHGVLEFLVVFEKA
ncbi:MAG TPA: YceI family protein [Acidimicrobiales bacterium]|jgi:polyisoprenoid-binding protein YceI|nr:YceI family protein [Acidimicrobiales bacterium]